MDDNKDLEIEAMGAVSKALTGLDEGARGRVIRWAAERYGVELAKSSRTPGKADAPKDRDEDEHDEEVEEEDGGGWDHFADLHDSAGPKSNSDRLLVAAYWVQVVEGKTQFGSFELNKLLKDLGHGVDNTAHAMTALINQKPALVLQLKKSGKSRQARKTFKVTTAGVKVVEQMIAANGA
ncbi:hypothetical protein ACI3KX_10110 [Microbacterium sp. ZW CA_36]|uniref:hypothetical protein n=1 Tax=Microbacterium sp. ZW CA_36 TaxID=3378078 RepID=UPI003853E95E